MVECQLDYHNFWITEDVVFKLIVLHQTVVTATETSSKMASTHCQKIVVKFEQNDI